MTRRAYLYFVLTFLFGVIVGGAGLYSYAWYWGHWHENFDKGRILRHLKSELNLSDSQVRQLAPLMDEWEKRLAELHFRLDPEYRSLREEFRDRIRKILSPDQVNKFNDLVRRRDERLKRLKSP